MIPLEEKRSVVIVDSYSELLSITSSYPDLKNVFVILLSRNFTLSEVRSLYDSYEVCCFDEFIDSANAKEVLNKKNDFLWDWFLDEDGRDLSQINGCSLGSSFAASLGILLNSVLRYKAGFGKILMEKDNVYFLSNTEDIFIDVINFLHKKIGFNLVSIDHKKNKKIVYRNINIDLDGRKRDLFNIFKKSKFKSFFVASIFDMFNAKLSAKDNRVLFMNSGKMESFIKHSSNEASGIQWVMPFTNIYDTFINLLKRKSLYYRFYSMELSEKDSVSINDIISLLKKNINKKKYLDSNLLIKVMNRYIFNVFHEAYGYYLCAYNKIKLLQLNAIIFSSEFHELSILVAQAGKNNAIKNIIMAHGLSSAGYMENKAGRFGVFEYALAFGNVDVLHYQYLGVKKDNIKISSFPYFEKFLPIKSSTKNKKYINAIVLAEDFCNDYTDKIGKSFNYYQDILNLLDGLEINLLAIKYRHDIFFVEGAGADKNQVEINGKYIPLLSGYSSFKEHAQNADLIIGPPSTAMIESALMGKDYFVYIDNENLISEIDSTQLPFVAQHFYMSKNIDQLRENIEKNRVFKKGFSVGDFVDLSKVINKADLFKKFNISVEEIVNNNNERNL